MSPRVWVHAKGRQSHQKEVIMRRLSTLTYEAAVICAAMPRNLSITVFNLIPSSEKSHYKRFLQEANLRIAFTRLLSSIVSRPSWFITSAARGDMLVERTGLSIRKPVKLWHGGGASLEHLNYLTTSKRTFFDGRLCCRT